MKQKILLLTLTLSLVTSLFAQSISEVSFRILDSRNDDPIVGATVTIADSDNKAAHSVSNYLGDCKFESVPYNEYNITATFIGYDTLRQSVVVDERIKNLGIFKMKPTAIKMDKVDINAVAIRTTQSGDTVIYNADAYKVASDATMDGLLSKMPGIKVDSDGEVEAQGETVQKVYLDGKEFFGDDVALAVKNIPADIISKVEVFNKLSDNAEFTGFDDGDSYKALNFITRTGMSSGHFGKFTAGYAHPELYQVSANYNYFRGNHRITVIGGANNMNIKNFGTMDLVGGGRRGGGGGGGGGGRSAAGGGNYSSGSSGQGLATIGSIGLNYGGTFKEERIKLESSYFYNMSDSETIRTTDAEYILDETTLETFGEDYKSYFYKDATSGSDNYNHRINARFEYKSENKRHMLMMRPIFTFQDTGSISYTTTDESETDENGENKTTTSIKVNDYTTDKLAYNVNNTLVYRALIGDKGRNIMVMGSGKYSVNDSDAYKVTEDTANGDTYYDVFDETTSYSASSSVMYSEPIMDRAAMLTLKYSIDHQYSDADYSVYDVEDALDAIFDPDMSNIYNSNNTTQSVTTGFMYSKKNILTLNANVSVQRTNLITEQEYPQGTPDGDYTFDHIMYGFTMRKTFNPTNSLRVNLRSRTSNPSITDLQEVLVDTDPTDIAYGNSRLAPSYANSFSMTYNRSNIMMGRTFMAMIGGSLTNDYIGEKTVLNYTGADLVLNMPDSYDGEDVVTLANRGEFTIPVNLDGMWSVNSSVSYGTPVSFLSSNLNLDAGISYSESPSIISYDDVDFFETTKMGMTYKAGATLGSNINENIDFTLSYSGSLSTTDYRNSGSTSYYTRNSYFTNKATAKFKFVFLGGFTFFGDATFTQYAGITDDFNEQYVLCNLSLGHKLFKNNRGEISLNVNDLFNQSESFTRTITDTYIANVKTNTIGRYFGVKFTFDLRKFKGSNTLNIDDNTGGVRRERPSGGPGGMGGGMGMGGPGGM